MAPLDNPEVKNSMTAGQKVAGTLIQLMPVMTKLMMLMTKKMFDQPGKMLDKMLKQLPESDQAIFQSAIDKQMIIASIQEAFRNGIKGPASEMQLLFKPWGINLAVFKPVHGSISADGKYQAPRPPQSSVI